MRIRLNKAHFPVTALGPGRRIGLWVQGCHVRCPGCVSRDTWDPDPQREIEVDCVLAWCRDVGRDGIDGVTISGGEPFEQPEALAALLDGLEDWRRQLADPVDFLCFSGWPFRRLETTFPELLARLDAVVPEPYVGHLPPGGIWRGSANQALIPLSSLGHKVYAPYLEATGTTRAAIQVSIGIDEVWYIGIPSRGDMEKLENAARECGVILGGVSWRA